MKTREGLWKGRKNQIKLARGPLLYELSFVPADAEMRLLTKNNSSVFIWEIRDQILLPLLRAMFRCFGHWNSSTLFGPKELIVLQIYRRNKGMIILFLEEKKLIYYKYLFGNDCGETWGEKPSKAKILIIYKPQLRFPGFEMSVLYYTSFRERSRDSNLKARLQIHCLCLFVLLFGCLSSLSLTPTVKEHYWVTSNEFGIIRNICWTVLSSP